MHLAVLNNVDTPIENHKKMTLSRGTTLRNAQLSLAYGIQVH